MLTIRLSVPLTLNLYSLPVSGVSPLLYKVKYFQVLSEYPIIPKPFKITQ